MITGKSSNPGFTPDPGFTRANRKITSLDKSAAHILLREATDPASLQKVAPSAIDGVQRTLAEETMDPGIARLERTVRSSGGQFDALDRSNNAARIRALESFGQDENALAAAKEHREQATADLRNKAMLDSGVQTDAIKSVLADSIKNNATRPPVQQALLDVKKSLDNAGDDIFSLYGTRKYIGDLLSGKAGSDKSYAQAAYCACLIE